MKAIYEPKGKAKEYGNLACNLYKGCGHKCSYCYAPAVLRMDRQEFYDNPQPREGIIEALKKDAKGDADMTIDELYAFFDFWYFKRYGKNPPLQKISLRRGE